MKRDDEYTPIEGMKIGRNEKSGDQAPGLKHFIIVFGTIAIVVALSWIAWFKLGWFH